MTRPVARPPEELPVTHERLLEVLRYETDTGFFFWRVRRGRSALAGQKAGKLLPNGYVAIKIDQVAYTASRLAWFYIHGKWPEVYLDHVNGARSDNRLANLRECTQRQNGHNRGKTRLNTSGYKAAYANTQRPGKWYTTFVYPGNIKMTRVPGNFDSAKEAHEAHQALARKFYGEFVKS